MKVCVLNFSLLLKVIEHSLQNVGIVCLATESGFVVASLHVQTNITHDDIDAFPELV